MTRLAAILLLGIFSFNIFGYKIVAIYTEHKANEKMELAFDENDYTDQQLISIKQPTNLPYYQNSKTFQRIDGEIEIDGIFYKYVKCRIYNDSLEMLCIPNTAKMKIQAAKADFSRLVADIQTSAGKKKSPSESKSFQKIISEFEEQLSAVVFKPAPKYLTHFIKSQIFVNSLFTKTLEQPPDFPANNFRI